MKKSNSLSYREELEKQTAVYVYLDLSNMFHWQKILGWSFRIEDVLTQLLSITTVKEVKVYYGLNERQKQESEAFHKRIRKAGAILRAKPVKYIKKTINEALLFKHTTFTLFSQEMHTKITELIDEIRETGIVIEEPKCNFDVEMTMDILDDMDKLSAVVLFSGDSDLAAPLERLKLKGKRVYVIGVRGMTAFELHKVKDVYVDFGKFYRGKRKYAR